MTTLDLFTAANVSMGGLGSPQVSFKDFMLPKMSSRLSLPHLIWMEGMIFALSQSPPLLEYQSGEEV